MEARAGAITFSIELYVPWDALVDVFSEGVVPLRSIPDVIGLVGRREGAAESCVLQGRDARSVRVLVPDFQGADQNFHDVTIVDMGDMPESPVSIPELSTLSQQWPPAVLSHMGWHQKELEEMRAAAKVKFRRSRPSCFEFCGSLIKSDMYRHVARLQLDLDHASLPHIAFHRNYLSQLCAFLPSPVTLPPAQIVTSGQFAGSCA